jgi:hypothetical protein
MVKGGTIEMQSKRSIDDPVATSPCFVPETRRGINWKRTRVTGRIVMTAAAIFKAAVAVRAGEMSRQILARWVPPGREPAQGSHLCRAAQVKSPRKMTDHLIC